MKSTKLLVVGTSVLIVSMAAVVLGQIDQAGDSVHWRQLMQHDVSVYARERAPREGAPGASAIGFRISDAVQGGAIIVGLDRPALGVFVGLNTPGAFVNAPYKDLRVQFTLDDGSSRTVGPAAGGGMAMLFQSPDDVPVASLRTVALYVDDRAEWTK